jgi:branched-chain amino acid transport system permease protein
MLDILLSGLINGNTYVLIAIGMSLIFGVAKLVNFAHGSIVAIGAMLGWWFIVALHWPFWAALPGTIVLTAGLGLIIQFVCVRPLSNAPPIAALLATVAASFVLDYGSQILFSSETRAFPSQLPTTNIQLGGLRIGTLHVTILAVCVVSVVILGVLLKYTRLGQAIRATAQDREAALQMGISVGFVQGVTFALASALGGIAGVLVGMYQSSVAPMGGLNIGLQGFAAATLGGMGSMPGAIIGGLALGVAESFGISWFGGSIRQFVTFAILIGVLWLKPAGILGTFHPITSEPLTGTFFGGGRRIRLKAWQIVLLIGLATIAVPLLADDYLLQIANLIVVFAILALSLTLISGTAGQISLGQAGPFAIGAYISALLTRDHGWPFWFAFPVAGIGAAFLSIFLMRPVLRLRGHYVAIATLGTGAIIAAALLNLRGITYGSLGISGIPVPELFGLVLDTPLALYLLSLTVLLIVIFLVSRLQNSHLGRAWQAIREDEIASQASSVALADYKSLVFVIGGFIAGLAGSLLTLNYGYISPDSFDTTISTQALTVVVLGGMGNPLGAVIGSLVLIGVPEMFRILDAVRYLGYGVLLLLLIHFRPQGIWGRK